MRISRTWINVRSGAGTAIHTARRLGAVLLVITLGALGIVANILQLVSAGGLWIWLTVILAPTIGVFIFLAASPVLRRNVRGAWLFAALRRTGLADVEHRADRSHRLPPEQLFSSTVSGSILITGILDQLFQYHREELINFVRRGNELRVLLVHPTKVAENLEHCWASRHDEWVSYWLTNCNEARVALDAIIEAGLDRTEGFSVRFMGEMPPYFGMLIGDLSGDQSGRNRPFVRVQPIAVSKFIGRGSVVTFERIKSDMETPFDYFSDDLRAQWDAGLADWDLIEERRRAIRRNDHP